MNYYFIRLRQLFQESLVYGFSIIAANITVVLLTPLYTRFFTPDEYGIMGMITVVMTLATIFSVLGLDSAAHRWFWETDNAADRKKTLSSWFWCQIAVSLLLAALGFIFSDALAQWIVQRKEAAVFFRIASLTLPLSAINSVVSNWLRMQRKAGVTLFFSLGINAIMICLTILFVGIFHWGLNGVYAAQLLAAFAGAALGIFLMGTWTYPRQFDRERLREMLHYAVPMIAAGLGYWVLNSSNCFFIQKFSSIADVGIYQVGSTVASVVLVITGAFQLAWGPFALSIYKERDAQKVYAKVFLSYLLVTCCISMILSLFANEIISFLSNKQYYSANRVVGILAFNYVVTGLTYIAMIGLTIVKKTRPYGEVTVLAVIFNIILNLLLVPRWGKEGAAIATLISQAVVPIYLFCESQKYYPVQYDFYRGIGIIAFACIAAVVGGFVHWNSLFMSISFKIVLIAMFLTMPFWAGWIRFSKPAFLKSRIS